MSKTEKYKHLPINAKKKMYVSAALKIVIVSAIFVTAGVIIGKGIVLEWLPYRNVLAGILFLIAAIVDVFEVITPGILFKRYSYFIDEEEINIRSGVINHKVEIVPIERLHKIETNAGPIDRQFGLSSVIVYTAGGELNIDYLPIEEASAIADLLKNKVNEIIMKQRAEQ